MFWKVLANVINIGLTQLHLGAPASCRQPPGMAAFPVRKSYNSLKLIVCIR